MNSADNRPSPARSSKFGIGGEGNRYFELLSRASEDTADVPAEYGRRMPRKNRSALGEGIGRGLADLGQDAAVGVMEYPSDILVGMQCSSHDLHRSHDLFHGLEFFGINNGVVELPCRILASDLDA